MTERYKSLAEAQQALSHLNTLNRVKALAKVGVDWSIGEQSDEAELARHMATYGAIFEANRARGDRSLSAERNGSRVDHRRPETGLVQDDGSLASEGRQTLGQEGGLNPPTRANTPAAFEAQSGVAEAKEAAAWHWECKRKAGGR